MDFRTTIDISAPPQVVWGVMSDVEHWPDWTASVTSIRRLDGGPFTVGSRVLIRQPKFPPALWKATAVEPGRSFTWKSGLPGLHVYAHHTVEPIQKGSRVTLALDYDGLLSRLMVALTRSITERYLTMEAEGLKRRSEELARAK